MPGPISDSYDPEFGTAENANKIKEALLESYDKLTFEMESLGIDTEPIYILKICDMEDNEEKHLRLLRFAIHYCTSII